jgi:lysyl-tRNA synthetase class 2
MSTHSFQHFKQRSLLLKKTRNWFEAKNVLEVETPSISIYANTDPNLDSFEVKGSTLQGYLNTSPEFYIKQLLADGCPDCYQIARVYRDGEEGRYHQPEFTLLEWYRLGWDEFQLMKEVEQLITQLIENERNIQPAKYYSYTELFQKYFQTDPNHITSKQCVAICKQKKLHYPVQWENDQDTQAFLDLIVSQLICPQFSKDSLTFIYHYPAKQCSLAKCTTTKEGLIAQRFEVYWGALELGNGFNELQDAQEQQQRFEQENIQRQQQGKKILPLDKNLITALKKGLPQCSGVAIGIERLLMIAFKATHISQV